MSATQKNNITRLEQLDRQSTQPFPNSRKVYLTGSRPDIRVPVREISLADTPTAFGGEKNPPVFVYDTSGPYTDPEVRIDLRKGEANVLISDEELAKRRKELEAAGGYPIPASQTPWQEIQRATVGQAETGAVLENAPKYQRIAQTIGVPRHNH